MKNKTPLFIFIGIVLLVSVLYFFKKGNSTEKLPEPTTSNALPTLADLIAKGYDEAEAQSVLSALESGKNVNY